MKKEELIAFTDKVKGIWLSGKIRAPVHLCGGNEDELIEIFKDYKKNDWIFSTWRSHYHWLLSGRSEETLISQILDGNSMSITGWRFFTSSIVAGIAPIALGVAKSIKMDEDSGLYSNHKINVRTPHVWCFLGDMATKCGLAIESMNYAEGHDLPITFVVEDNNRSVTSDTRNLWGRNITVKSKYYRYVPTYPHAGTGKKVLF
ncbi:MAG: hypothetical protein EOM59_14945 [Clostridia bacterium]|nr:hypothetical protein [Clostridia bacterium]